MTRKNNKIKKLIHSQTFVSYIAHLTDMHYDKKNNLESIYRENFNYIIGVEDAIQELYHVDLCAGVIKDYILLSINNDFIKIKFDERRTWNNIDSYETMLNEFPEIKDYIETKLVDC